MNLKIIFNFLYTAAVVMGSPGKLNIMIHSSEGSRSHIKAILEISEVLLQRGHLVTYAAMEDKLRYATGYNVTQFSIGKLDKEPLDLRKYFRNILDPKKKLGHSELMLDILQGLMLDNYDEILIGLEEYTKRDRPDLMVCDFAAGACTDVAQKYGIPLIIGMQSTDMFGIISAPYITKTMTYAPMTTESLSLLDRLYYQIIEPILAMRFKVPLKKRMDAKKVSHNIPTKPTLMGDFSYGLGLANTFTGFEPAMSIPTNIKLVGPIVSKNQVNLDDNLLEFMNQHKRTIYIGFGTLVVLSNQEVKMILEAGLIALNNQAIDGIIWGLGRNILDDFPSSIFINGTEITKDNLLNHPHLKLLTWVPQQSILEHDNCVLYFNHGGLESIIESLASATPMVVIPYLPDQPRNAAKVESMGVGIYINRLTMDVPKLVSTITYWSNHTQPPLAASLPRLQHLTKLNSQYHLPYAASIMESHAYLAKACRPHQPYQPPHPPCELEHLVPASTRMSYLQRTNLDLHLILVSLVVGFIFIVNQIFKKSINRGSTDSSQPAITITKKNH